MKTSNLKEKYKIEEEPQEEEKPIEQPPVVEEEIVEEEITEPDQLQMPDFGDFDFGFETETETEEEEVVEEPPKPVEPPKAKTQFDEMQDMLGAMPRMDLDTVFKQNPMGFEAKREVVEQVKEPQPVPEKKEPVASPIMNGMVLLPAPELPEFTEDMLQREPAKREEQV